MATLWNIQKHFGYCFYGSRSIVTGLLLAFLIFAGCSDKNRHQEVDTVEIEQNEPISGESQDVASSKKQKNLAYIDAGYLHRGHNREFHGRASGVMTYEQAGPESWESSSLELPDKLKVEILGKAKGRTPTGGTLIQVRCADCDNSDVSVVSERSVSLYNYWNCSTFSAWTDALKYGTVITRLSNNQVEVLTRFDKKWVDINSFYHDKILCFKQRYTPSEHRIVHVECEIYRRPRSVVSFCFVL